jgi:ketosteroid isomerase-like protein
LPAISPQACSADFTAALIRRDMDAATALLADDVVFFYSNGTELIGKDAFAAVMATNWQMVEDYRYSTLDPVWIAQSDAAAAVVYGFAWSGVARGQSVSGGGRGTRVFRKGPRGWLIAHEHLSVGQRAPTTTA